MKPFRYQYQVSATLKMIDEYRQMKRQIAPLEKALRKIANKLNGHDDRICPVVVPNDDDLSDYSLNRPVTAREVARVTGMSLQTAGRRLRKLTSVGLLIQADPKNPTLPTIYFPVR